MEFPILDIEFTKDGAVFSPAQQTAAIAAVAQASDAIVIVHGWNNDMAEARDLYARFFGHARALLDDADFADLRQRRLVALQVFWPSKKFAERDLIPGGGAAALADDDQQAQRETQLKTLLDRLAIEPERLGGADVNPLRQQRIDQAKQVIPSLADSPEAQRVFVDALRSAFVPDAAEPDDGSNDIFDIGAEQLFKELSKPVVDVPGPLHQGGAAAMDGSPAAAIGDFLSGPLAAARRIGNFFTYYEMKQRAGKVGQNGLAPLVAALKAGHPALRIHLVGHSFGGRLVTAAAAALPSGTGGITLTLLQAALSHNALAARFGDDGLSGAFHRLLSNGKTSWPIVITHTKNDRAVGISYPLASRFARDKSASLGDRNDPYGGMGRNGAQHLDTVHVAELDDVRRRLVFPHDQVTNLLADRVIADHGDVANRFVVGAVLDVVRA